MVDSTLAISDLYAGYGALEILHGVDMNAPGGQLIALMGPNGAGKSTLLKTVFGLATFMRGSIRLKGSSIAKAQPRAVLAKGIAYVAQGRCNFPLMSVDENLEMASYAMKVRQTKAEREYIYDIFPILKERHRQLAGNLSGGEQQLLEMAMAMLRRPEILLVDEPSAGLSPQAVSVVFEELKRLHKGGRTILLVEQNTRKAMEICERAIVMRLGKIIWDGATPEITQKDLGDLFMTGKLDRTDSGAKGL